MFNLWLVAQDGKSKQLLANSTDPNDASIKNFELTKSDKVIIIFINLTTSIPDKFFTLFHPYKNVYSKTVDLSSNNFISIIRVLSPQIFVKH